MKSGRTSPALMKNPPVALASGDQEIRLGVSLQQAGNLQGAVECFRRALAIDPSSFVAYNQLAGVFASLRDWETAMIFTRAAVELNPASAELQSNLALLYARQGQTEFAIEHFRRAVDLNPNEASNANSLGNALRQGGLYAEAEAWILRALSLKPDYPEAYINLGFLCYRQQKPASLVENFYRKAIALAPNLAQAHVNLSHCLLQRGAFAEGWVEHEWRWRWKDFPSPKRDFTQPQWRGEPTHGARVLLHAEQGFGDTIQFLRYVPFVAERETNIVLEVHPELRSLVDRAVDGIQVISRGDPIPEFDWHCPLLSLPLAFGTELKSIPATVPYLRVDAEAPDWLHKQHASNLHVGLVWAGGASNIVDRDRSLSLEALSPLWQVKGMSFYSLQRGPAGVDAESGPLSFAACQPQTGDFAATAAAIAHLDLIITVDTSVAHLAGALGKPVWILLPVRPDWRWLTERDDSPWYPTATLFRQKVDGDWNPVIVRLAAGLERKAAGLERLAAYQQE